MRRFTDEHRRNISRAARGRPAVSAETRAKISAAGRGRPKSAEHRAKIAAAHLGKPKPRRSIPRYIVMDRGFGECWITHSRPIKLKWVRELWAERLGTPGEAGVVYMHLCEIYGEQNHCANPEHVRVGTQSDNVNHALDLRAATGRVRQFGR